MKGVKKTRRLLRNVGVAIVVLVLSAAIADGAAGAKYRKPAERSARARGVHRIAPTRALGLNAIVGDSGCQANALPANDDESSEQPVALPFPINFFGTTYSQLWVNNNGNVTFSEALGEFTPFEITAKTPPIIAPFFADVDTRPEGSPLVTYGTTTFQGHKAFCVNWPYVGYYSEHLDKRDAFQLLLVERGDVEAGAFDIVFNYDTVQWETGDASGGQGGFGGTPAAAGFSNGDGQPGHFFELPGSLESGAFLDSNGENGLIHNGYGSNQPGRYVFHITSGGGAKGGTNLERPWPKAGYGYNFQNEGLSSFLFWPVLTTSNVITSTGLDRTFSDWRAHAGGLSGGIASWLGHSMDGGMCFGLALSGGRFDALLEPLTDPGLERTASEWSDAGSGSSATMQLPEPTVFRPTFSREFLSLASDDFVTQLSREVNTSLQWQHFAFADPLSGAVKLQLQLEGAMADGANAYDPSGRLSGPSNTGFAMVLISEPTTRGWVGHAVLAYSLTALGGGAMRIGVWDNNFPGVPYEIDVNANGTWTYSAPYQTYFRGTLSMSGASNLHKGLVAALPLYSPTRLHFYPEASHILHLGAGELVDVPAGITVEHEEDGEGNEVDVEPVFSSVNEAGQVVDFPSGTGSLRIAGESPSLNVRGEESEVAAKAQGNGQLEVTSSEQDGSIQVRGMSADLEAGRAAQLVATSGASSLRFAKDGSVSIVGDGGGTTVTLTFEHGGVPVTTTLYSGPLSSGSALALSAAQLAEAEARAVVGTGATGGGQSQGGLQGAGGVGGFRAHVATLRLSPTVKVNRKGIAMVPVSCTGPNGSTCAGTVTLVAMVRHRALRPGRHGRPVKIVGGSGKYAVHSGFTGIVRVRLSPKMLALIRHARAGWIHAKAIPRPSEGLAAVAAVELRLAAVKRSRPK